LTSMRLMLTRFEIEVIEVDSRDAASEVFACVRSDGMEMSEVAEESRYPFHRSEVLLEDIAPDQQQLFLSAKAGALVEPIPDDDFEKLQALLREEQYDFGDLIVKQGEPANAFYVLISGRARAVKTGSNDGEEIVLGSLRPGDSFGEAALIEGGTRTATVRCSTSVEVLRLDRSDFLALAENVPELKQHVQMTRRIRTLQGFLYEFSNFGRLPTPALRGMI